jgi:hypothetical protein
MLLYRCSCSFRRRSRAAEFFDSRFCFPLASAASFMHALHFHLVGTSRGLPQLLQVLRTSLTSGLRYHGSTELLLFCSRCFMLRILF